MGVGLGLSQHALVEREPTELSVDIQGGIREIGAVAHDGPIIVQACVNLV